MRRNITLVLAVIFTLGGSSLVLSDDLHGVAPALPSDQNAASADDAAASESKNPTSEDYRSFFLDLTGITGRPDFTTILSALRRQIDIVEGVGLSQRVLEAFHSVPILVDEFGCMSESATQSQTAKPVVMAACYGSRVPGDLANDVDISRGVVILRPMTLANYNNEQRPIVLHELLHFYHAHIFPLGIEDPTILFHYKAAKSIYQNADGYALSNEKEFFAVTASIFLYGKDTYEPSTRAQLKEKQPDYYNYLVWLFGFDPDRKPLASAQ